MTDRISRRTVAKGIAWAAPAVAVSAAVPAYAVSPFSPPTWSLTAACKSPGNSCKSFPKGYRFTWTLTNPNNFPITVQILSYAVTGTNLTLTPVGVNTVSLPAKGSQSFTAEANSSNSANAKFDFTVTFEYCRTNSTPPPATECFTATTDSLYVSATPPDCECFDTASQKAEGTSTTTTTVPTETQTTTVLEQSQKTEKAPTTTNATTEAPTTTSTTTVAE